MYDLLPSLWPRSGAPMLRCTICCRCVGIPDWCPNAKMYKLLPVLWSRSGGPMLTCTVCCRCFGLMLRCTICCCFGLEVVSHFQKVKCIIGCLCFGLEVVPQCKDVRFVAVALVSKWCPNAKNVRFAAVALVSKWCLPSKMYDLLPLLWSRSGASFSGCAICSRC